MTSMIFNVTIQKICLLFTAKILLDFNEYLSFYEHISLTAVPRMSFFPYSIICKHFVINMVNSFIIFLHLCKIFNVLATK